MNKETFDALRRILQTDMGRSDNSGEYDNDISAVVQWMDLYQGERAGTEGRRQ